MASKYRQSQHCWRSSSLKNKRRLRDYLDVLIEDETEDGMENDKILADCWSGKLAT